MLASRFKSKKLKKKANLFNHWNNSLGWATMIHDIFICNLDYIYFL